MPLGVPGGLQPALLDILYLAQQLFGDVECCWVDANFSFMKPYQEVESSAAAAAVVAAAASIRSGEAPVRWRRVPLG
jgi:hypothetical protein